MFTAALFTIANIRKQSKCPSADEWIRKMCYIHIQWSTTQPKKRTKFAAILVDLENIMLSKIRDKKILYITHM